MEIDANQVIARLEVVVGRQQGKLTVQEIVIEQQATEIAALKAAQQPTPES